MQQIYKRASRSLVWLGVDDSEGIAKTAIETINEIAPTIASLAGMETTNLSHYTDIYEPVAALEVPTIMKVAHDLTQEQWLALDYFYEKPWFSRLWVVRELNSSPNPLSFIGPHSVDSNLVALLAAWITFISKGFLRDVGLAKNNNIRKAGCMRRSVFRRDPKPCRVLHYARRYNAADPRDRVYAMLNIPEFAAAWKPYGAADYTLSTEEVFRNIAEITLRDEKDLLLFSYISHQGEVIPSPSWIPRWDIPTTSDSIWWSSMNHWNACGSRKLSLPETLDSKVFTVSGIEIFTITSCQKVPQIELGLNRSKHSADPSERASLAEAWRQFLGLTKSYQNEEDLIGAYSQTLRCGLDEYSKPTGSDKMEGQKLMAYLVMACGDKAPLSPELQKIGEEQLASTSQYKMSYLGWVYGWAAYRTFFVTKDGQIGMGPDNLQEGDVVCVLFGGMVPFILRPEDGHYLLVGECYCHGMMQGEMIEEWENGTLAVKEKKFQLH
jgi:Heterokaryon incompatibility protein (HET)